MSIKQNAMLSALFPDVPWEMWTGEEIYDALIEAGRTARERMDNCQFRLGDLALTVETLYGEDRLGHYAAQIGIPVSTLRNYRWVAGRFQNFPRGKFLEGGLTFSHFKTVAALDDPLPWLERALDEGWSTHRLEKEIRDAKKVATAAQSAGRRAALEPVEMELRAGGQLIARRGDIEVVAGELRTSDPDPIKDELLRSVRRRLWVSRGQNAARAFQANGYLIVQDGHWRVEGRAIGFPIPEGRYRAKVTVEVEEGGD